MSIVDAVENHQHIVVCVSEHARFIFANIKTKFVRIDFNKLVLFHTFHVATLKVMRFKE